MRTMRRLLLPLLVCALALGLTGQALADPAPSPTPSPGLQSFSCLGRITTVDQAAGTITVTVKHASLALQGSVGQSLTLTVTADSAISAVSRCAKSTVALADVPVGDMLVAHGTIDATGSSTVYDIGTACVWRPFLYTRFLCLGTVSSVDLQASALVVHVSHGSCGMRGSIGKDVTIYVPASARIFAVHHRFATVTSSGAITAGDRVCIGGTVDRSNSDAPVFTAARVFVHQVTPAGRLTWYGCLGQVSSVDQANGTITVAVRRGTRAVHAAVGGELTLTMTAASVIRTLADGAVATVALTDVQPGESIVVCGPIDRSNQSTPVYDVGHAFVWQPTTT